MSKIGKALLVVDLLVQVGKKIAEHVREKRSASEVLATAKPRPVVKKPGGR